MKARLALAVTLILMISAIGVGTASAHTSRATYDWHVGDALLQSIGFPVGNQAMAPNGDVVTIVGTGSFSANGKWASGGGTFSHHVAATGATTTGTFTADRVIDRKSTRLNSSHRL